MHYTDKKKTFFSFTREENRDTEQMILGLMKNLLILDNMLI